MWDVEPQNDDTGSDEPHELTPSEVAEKIRRYEQALGMTKEEFLERLRAGTAPDTLESNLLRMLLPR